MGKKKYTQLCAVCHGAKGNGDGPGAVSLRVKPSAFGKGEYLVTDGSLTKILYVLKKGSMRNGMAAYDWLPQKERKALAHYIQHLTFRGTGKRPPFRRRLNR